MPVAYTAMHGVGGDTLLAAFDRAGWSPPYVVAEQQEPNGSFPTVSFPNPEEPGAMDLLLALAAERDAAIAIANDPDADRLGAAIPQPDGGWRRLYGDEIGWLLADHILRHTSGDDRLVITTLVSSSMLGRMAAAHGVHYAETYTGFKWIGHTVLSNPSGDSSSATSRPSATSCAAARWTRTGSPPRCCWPRSPRSPPPRA